MINIKFLNRFDKNQQLELLEDLIFALKADQSPLEAMRNSKEFCIKKNFLAYNDIYETLSTGKPLSKALEGWFDPIIIMSIAAGEGRGKILESLENAKNTLENQLGVTAIILKAITYPLILIMLGITFNIVIAIYVIEPMLVERALSSFPFLTRLSYGIASFFMYYGWLLVLLTIGVILFTNYYLKTAISEFRVRLDERLIFRQYRMIISSVFLRSMAVMLASKESHNKALSIIGKNSDPYLKAHVNSMIENTTSGRLGLGQVIDTGLLVDQEIARMKSITSKSNKNVDTLLIMIAQRHERLLERSMKIISQILFYIGLFFVAMIIIISYGGQFFAQLMQAGATF